LTSAAPRAACSRDVAVTHLGHDACMVTLDRIEEELAELASALDAASYRGPDAARLTAVAARATRRRDRRLAQPLAGRVRRAVVRQGVGHQRVDGPRGTRDRGAARRPPRHS